MNYLEQEIEIKLNKFKEQYLNNLKQNEKLLEEFCQSIEEIFQNKNAAGTTNRIRAFLNKLTKTEVIALQAIAAEIGEEGNVSIVQMTEKTNISRPVYTSLFYKMKEDKIAYIDNRGVKGTYIKLIDKLFLNEIKDFKN
jgi:GTP-sensing pleiotropic transcriptional regulator CodY